MERLYAPWRIDYILGKEREPGCIFCTKPADDNDDENLIVHRAEGAFTIMNKFPYNNGHLLVCPYRHVSDICELSPEENSLLIEEVTRAVKVLRSVMRPTGFNLGLNIGVDAGAGIDDHLHYHVVPRWRGDTNCLPVLADVRIISEHIRQTWKKLHTCFREEFPPTPPKEKK
ncbi:MAG: HIT domain-containing protein [Desulfomonile sp.]|nr:HIT domain-containing protein [Desulfomonile sp.]